MMAGKGRPLAGSGTKAMTFVEILMATAVLGMAFIGVIWYLSRSHADVRDTLAEVTASNLASEIIETVQALPFEILAPIDGPLDDPSVLALAFPTAESRGYPVRLPEFPKGFTGWLSITPATTTMSIPSGCPPALQRSAESAAGLLQIKVRIEWLEDGRRESAVLMSLRGATW